MQSHGLDAANLQSTNLILKISELDNTIDFPTWFFPTYIYFTFSFFPFSFYEREKRDTLFFLPFWFMDLNRRFRKKLIIFSSLSSFDFSIVQFKFNKLYKNEGKKVTNKN